ncbi:hypothetical protein [Chryseobacterium gambrini]|uniref:hypothetical protein n=1 Tax=Chryseobacterium gambrini TaxID=373672 RepID=UPI0025B31D8D|nr:hypothetical protein [Chryseobacterium gambrini]MDN4031370.1 hypothetical protein [Chryseobacterium gambrini]
MTLVVAKIIKDDIQIISDTKITDIYLGTEHPLKGQLKTIILTPFITLSFSGNPEYAKDILKLFYSGKILNIQTLLIKCLEKNKESKDQTHFLICSYTQNIPSIFKISNYQIEQNLKNAWIGDKIGFNKYQEYYHTSESIPDFERMENAFNSVIKNNAIETIGDFTIRVQNETDSITNSIKFFNYQINRINLFGPYEFESNDNVVIIKAATANKGGYGISFLRSLNPQIPAFAIFFNVGKFGLLFFPLKYYSNGKIYKNLKNGEEFAFKIKSEIGFDVQGLIPDENNSLYKNFVTIQPF